MRFVQINDDYYINPEMVQAVFLRQNEFDGSNQVCVAWNHGVSEAPSLSLVSQGYCISKFSLKRTLDLLTK